MKFIILCYPRTGSTLLITALGAHPDLRQGMEIFNPEQEGDDLWVHWRNKTFKKLYGEQETYLNAQKNLDGERFDLSLLSKEFFQDFDGTKVMYDQLDRNSKVWDHLRSLKDLRIIILKRNIVEAAVSFRIAMETNIWFLPNQDSYIWYVSGEEKTPLSPCITYETWYFDWFYNYYCAAEEFFVNLFTDQKKLTINYSDLVSDWEKTLRSIQIHLGVEPINIPMMFDKRTHGTMQELVANYDEIRNYYSNHPILAKHFETAFKPFKTKSSSCSSLPKTFCILPFFQALITNDGKLKLCSQTLAQNLISNGQVLSLHHMTLEHLWNSEYLQSVRSSMVRGEKIEACAKCYQKESEGGTSLRQLMNTHSLTRTGKSEEAQIFEQAQAIINKSVGNAHHPSALHLWLGNLCNLNCRMCSSMFSSQIALDSVHHKWFDDWARSAILLPIYLNEVEYHGLGELIKRGDKTTRRVVTETVSICFSTNGDRIDLIEISGWKYGHEEFRLSVTTERGELASYWLPQGEWKFFINPVPIWCPNGRIELSLKFIPLPRIQSLLHGLSTTQSNHTWLLNSYVEIEQLKITTKAVTGQGQPKEIASRFPENPQWFNNKAVLFNEILEHPEALQFINFTGGEPLINPSFSLILEKLIEVDHSSHISLYINTNGSKYSRTLSDLVSKFQSVEIAISIDGLGEVQEYIRHPSKWNIVSRNLFSFQKDSIPISIRPTIQAYNIFGVLDLARWCSENHLRFYLDNVLWNPRFLSLDMLPQSIIDQVLPDWLNYLETECSEDNRWHVETVIAALRRPRPDAEELIVLQKNFIQFTNDLDQSRDQSLRQVCPQLYDGLIAAGFDFCDNYRFFKPKTMIQSLSNATIVITTCEVNQRHGTGSLVKRIVGDTPNIFSIRSLDLYGGEQEFGDLKLRISLHNLSREEAIKTVLSSLDKHSIQSIQHLFCIPFISDDLIIAIALHDFYQVPLVAHIMDDQNICIDNIPDDLMREFLSKCSLRLVTHPELREAYENKYGFKFWLLPAVVSNSLVSNVPRSPDLNSHSSSVGALIGSLWNQELFELLCTTLKDASISLNWYNGSVDEYGKTQYFWLQDNPEKIKELGINPYGLLSEESLAGALKTYSYLVVPTGILDENDANPRLWRIIFAVATANIPIIILGHQKTSAAYFIQRFNLGTVCDYDGESLKQAIEQISDRGTQQEIRKNAAAIATQLSDIGINYWLWESLKQGKPCDFRFENLLAYSHTVSQPSPVTETSKDLMTAEDVYRYFPSGISHAYSGHIVGTNNIDYIDLMSAWGSNILGYGYGRIAEAVSAQMLKYANVGMVGPEWHKLQDLLIRLIPCAEGIHLVKNGSDATATAVRLARFVTGRDIVLHRGYHGVQDWYMASLDCPGVPTTHHAQIISLTTLDVETVEKIFAENPKQIACLILDPMVWPVPDREIIIAIQKIVKREGALLIFDEVVSGFRIAIGGAQELWDVSPDLACYGKCIANGLPLSVLVGQEKWMQQIPLINYGLTFGLEAVSIIAAIETISEIVELDICSALAKKGRFLKHAYSKICYDHSISSALVGHDCRPEIWFEETNGLSNDYCKNIIIQELAQKKICTYGVFNLTYSHNQEDLEAIINALEHGLEKVKIAMKRPSSREKQQLLNLRENITNLNSQLEQSHTELAQSKKEIEAMMTSKFWKLRTVWFSIKRKLGLPIT